MHLKTSYRLAAVACAVGISACGGAQPAAPVAQSAMARAIAGIRGASTVDVTVDASAPGAVIGRDVLGVNFGAWHDITQFGMAEAVRDAGLRFVRWPGGSLSDQYHWQTATWCGNTYVNGNSTFDHFMQDIVAPVGADVAITANYGSNAACNADGDPAEAAAWVDYANNLKHYGIKWWTIGNEVYGSWEYDLHQKKNDPVTYANAVATGYYPQMKAKDASIKVGAVVAGGYSPSWDQYVLTHAKFDFVEDHWYAQAPGQESDAYLLDQAPSALASELTNVRTEMNAAGVPSSVPIFLGEFSSVYASPGKQSVSIVSGLFTGEVVARLLQKGIPLATVWISFGGCNNGNNSPQLYGWQTFGTYTIFSDGLPESGCGQPVAFSTPFPAARAYQLLSHFAQPAKHMLGTTVNGSGGTVLAYAATHRAGYAYLLFNLSETSTTTAAITLTHASKSSFTATSYVYDKAIYDHSKNGTWPGPKRTALGTVGASFAQTLTPWSMTVIDLE